MRVCYFGTYRASYSRNKILVAGLKAQGITVFETHATLWRGIEDRITQASGGWMNPAFLWRVLRAYWNLFRAHNRTPEYDVMLIGYPGHFDTFLGRLLSWHRKRPMAFDILMSLHLVAEERGITERHPHTARLIFALEKLGLRLPDLLIAENKEYGLYIRNKYQLPEERFSYLSHGADDRVFYPRSKLPPKDSFRVSYHGTYVPSHGLETIIEAARILRTHTEIYFEFYGTGQEHDRIAGLVGDYGLSNVHFHGFVSQEELLDGIASSHICLGVFGVTRQALFTVQNKLWEGLAMGRPIVSGKAAAVSVALRDREHIYLVERSNPEALADAILELQADPALRERLATSGHAKFIEGNSITALGAKASAILRELIDRQSKPLESMRS